MEATVAAGHASSRYSPQSRAEGAVGSVALRQHAQTAGVEHRGRYRALRWRLETPQRMIGEEALHLCIVLFGLERARAVHEQTSGRDDRRRGPKDLTLQRSH